MIAEGCPVLCWFLKAHLCRDFAVAGCQVTSGNTERADFCEPITTWTVSFFSHHYTVCLFTLPKREIQRSLGITQLQMIRVNLKVTSPFFIIRYLFNRHNKPEVTDCRRDSAADWSGTKHSQVIALSLRAVFMVISQPVCIPPVSNFQHFLRDLKAAGESCVFPLESKLFLMPGKIRHIKVIHKGSGCVYEP